MRSVIALCVLLLAACANQGSPEAQSCQAQMFQDPDVERLIAASAGSQTFARQHQYELQDAKRAAELRCLRARGAAEPGGVEEQKREPNSFEGLF